MHTGADPKIAERVCECIEAEAIGHGYTIRQELIALGVSRALHFRWREGGLPSAMALQRMALRGYDVRYILTGEAEAGRDPLRQHDGA